ncbi:MAG: DUF5301 domain-containing protein [Clostridia bacterium]|nr:DUF5301 domain-containing protein [Clostridia bacterium]
MKKRSIIIVVFAILIVLMSLLFLYITANNKTTYTLNIPVISDTSNVIISSDNRKVEFNKQVDIKEIINVLASHNRTTKIESIQDFPINATKVITITISHKVGGKSTLYVYEKNSKFYIEQPYNGIYELSADEYNFVNNVLNGSNVGLDFYYNDELSKGYFDIKEIRSDYSIEDAIKDNCFVVNHAKVYNENLYEEFMNKYKSKQSAFLRLVQPTVEGDLIIYDIKYHADIQKVIIVIDNTRDKFTTSTDRIISLQEYDEIGTYKYKDNEYLIVYNGEVNDTNFESGNNVFVLTVVN